MKDNMEDIQENQTSGLFALGEIIVTEGAMGALAHCDISKGIARHHSGDWGAIYVEDKELNDRALVHGGRLVSMYCCDTGPKFLIITEADRSRTTVLLPVEY